MDYPKLVGSGLSEVEKLGQHDDPLSAHRVSPEVIVSRRDNDDEGTLGNDEEVLSDEVAVSTR